MVLFTCLCRIPRNAGLDDPDIAGRSRSGAHPKAVLADLICVVPFGIPLFFSSDLSA